MTSFAMIEVPGEANPLTEGILYHVLRSASSSDPNQIQTGTKQLQQWEKAQGFYPLLQSVFMDKSLPFEVRYLAVIQLKNGIDKYWRKTATNAASKEDKSAVRARLLESGINEPDHRLVLQNALVIAKVVRIEYPNDWPELFDTLLSAARTSFDGNGWGQQLSNTLLIILYVVKELSTARLLRTRTLLQQVTPEVFYVLGQIYIASVGKENEEPAVGAMGIGLLALKAIRRLLIAGYEFPSRSNDVQEFWVLSRKHLGRFLPYVMQENTSTPPETRKLIEKLLMQLAKFHVAMAQSHPNDLFLLPNSVDLVRDYWSLVAKLGETWGSSTLDGAKIGTDGDAEDDAPILERLSLKGLVLIRASVGMAFYPQKVLRYRHPQEKDEKQQAIQLVKTELLTETLVKDMLSALVTKFFVFRASDLRMWEEEPDEWEKMEEGGEDWEFAIRPCAEKLFLDLAKNFKDLILQPLLQVFQSVASPDNEDVLFKDSVYTAIGLAADILANDIDFDAFINNTLVAEVQKQKPGYNIIRRRIAIIIAQWITVKISDATKPTVYQIFCHLLNRDDPLNDQVVRVTAGRMFNDVANEWEFKAANFMPYAAQTLDRLMALIQEVELSDTKLALLNTISVIVERLEHHITPYADSIINILPPLWDQSGEEHLMKQAILTILTRLTNAMKADSRRYHLSFLPIIKQAIEPGSETQVYLLEDAMDLWQTIVQQTPSAPEPVPQELIGIMPFLIPLFSVDGEILRRTLLITESYLMLVPQAVFEDSFRKPMIEALANLMGNLKSDANGIVTHLVQLLIRGADGFGGTEAVKILTGDLMQSGFLAKVKEGLRGAWEHHQRHGPVRELPSRAVDGVVETDYFTILARIGLASPDVLYEALWMLEPNTESKTTTAENDPARDWWLEELFYHLDNIGDPPSRKLTCLFLCRLMNHSGFHMQDRLQGLMTAWTDVLRELTDGEEDMSADALYWPDNQNPATSEPEAPEDVRRRELIYSDPIHALNLVTIIRESLQACIQACGGEQHFQEEWLSRVDKDVIKAFAELGIMG